MNGDRYNVISLPKQFYYQDPIIMLSRIRPRCHPFQGSTTQAILDAFNEEAFRVGIRGMYCGIIDRLSTQGYTNFDNDLSNLDSINCLRKMAMDLYYNEIERLGNLVNEEIGRASCRERV